MKRTETNPFPPLASPSFRPVGCLFMASRLFCWYSSSMVIAATPFAMVPVILEAAPAIPPVQKIHKSLFILKRYNLFYATDTCHLASTTYFQIGQKQFSASLDTFDLFIKAENQSVKGKKVYLISSTEEPRKML